MRVAVRSLAGLQEDRFHASRQHRRRIPRLARVHAAPAFGLRTFLPGDGPDGEGRTTFRGGIARPRERLWARPVGPGPGERYQRTIAWRSRYGAGWRVERRCAGRRGQNHGYGSSAPRRGTSRPRGGAGAMHPLAVPRGSPCPPALATVPRGQWQPAPGFARAGRLRSGPVLLRRWLAVPRR